MSEKNKHDNNRPAQTPPAASGQAGEGNPWTKLSTRVVFETPWIRVNEDEVLNPAGRPSRYGVVHFKNRAVGVLAVDDEGYTYLVGQWRYTIERYSWEIPEGGSPVGEDTLANAKRELEEETGLKAAQWEPLFVAELSNSVTDETGIVYLARGLSQGRFSPEETEVLNVRRLPLAEAVGMAERGEIRDVLSVAALFKARVLQAEGKLPGGRREA